MAEDIDTTKIRVDELIADHDLLVSAEGRLTLIRLVREYFAIPENVNEITATFRVDMDDSFQASGFPSKPGARDDD